tara:strand:- start:121 stop:306 length:186 start_codon:yes stop_codon:yes gene_type:complete
MDICLRCEEKSAITIGLDKPLCAKHYVAEEEEGCLRALIESNPSDEILDEIKKQKPQLISE